VKALTQLTIPTRSLGAALTALAATFTACLAFQTGTAQAAACPNEAIREAQTSAFFPEGTVNLPDCMALELVSPAKKFNQYAQRPNFSANGERVEFSSLAALAETPKQGSFNDAYIATRGSSGWSTDSTATPPELLHGSSIIGEACSFSPDLSRWALWASTPPQAYVGITTPFQGGLGGLFSAIGPTMAPVTGDLSQGVLAIIGGKCEGASSDASHLFFAINEKSNGAPGYSYLPGDPVPDLDYPAPANVYEAYLDGGMPTLVLMQRDRNGVAYGGNCGAEIGSRLSANFVARRGSISPDASRIYFATRPGQPEGTECDQAAHKLRIMKRLETPTGPEISELIPDECTRVAPACSTADSDDLYLGASQEGDKVFFSTTRQLANSDRDEGKDLYLYEASSPAGERLTQVSAGDNTDPTPGEGAEFLGLADYSGDGSHAYFVAKGVLTASANQAGKSAEAGKPNLYLYERDAAHPAGRTVFIATLNSTDESTWNGSPGEENFAMAVPRLGADPEDQSVGGDGHILVFTSAEALSADDTDGQSDIYRYDATSGALERVSKADPGGEDNGAFETVVTGSGYVFAGPQNVSFGRKVSEDGKTIVFTTKEALDPNDANETENAYLWHEGAVTVLPSPDQAGASETTVSMSGKEVAFVDTGQLLPEDGDAAKDVYLLRADGGFPLPVAPTPCQGETCQGPPAAPPAKRGAASAASTVGNVKKEAPCKKGFSRKRGKCVKHQSKKRHRKHAKKANREQGAQR
jgi:hypothetical protein